MKLARLWPRVLVVVVVGAVLAACGTGGSPAGPSSAEGALDVAPLDAPATVTIGVNPSITALSMYVAQERGYFAAEKLKVEMPPITSSVDAMPLLATGRIDAFVAAPGAGYINNVRNGVDAKYVASFGNPRPGGANSAFVALKGGPITDVASLKGHKVAVVGGKVGVGAFFLSEILGQAHLTLDDVTVVELNMPDGVVALSNGSVDMAYVLGVTARDLLGGGTHILVGDMDAVLAEGTGAGIVYGSRLLGQDSRVGAAFLRAIQRGAKDLQGDYVHDDRILSIMSKSSKLPQDALAKQAAVAPVFSTDLVIDPSFFERLQRFFLARVVIANGQSVATDQVFDQRFVGAIKNTA
jgi:NitT/TauT family transport system substrate-binding protein